MILFRSTLSLVLTATLAAPGVAQSQPTVTLGSNPTPGQGGHGLLRFQPLTTFGIPDGVAEIVDASGDGRTLVFTDSNGRLGFVDIRNPSRPRITKFVDAGGEPTSVSIVGNLAIAAVWTDKPEEGSPPPAFLPGKLRVIDLSDPRDPKLLGSVDIGFHPDSIKLARVGRSLVAVVAIENEPVVVENGLVTGDDVPGNPNDQSPAGFVQVITLNLANVARSNVANVMFRPRAMAAAGLEFPSDPQPEFVDIHGTTVAVTLQENNGMALIDIADPSAPVLRRLQSLGTVKNRVADMTEDDAIDFSEIYPKDATGDREPKDASGRPIPAGSRMADALAFSPDGLVIYTADEGELDFTGGRGVSAWSTRTGRLLWEDRGLLERVGVSLGHYPEGRSENKGIEFEGVTTATFGRNDYAFFLSERGSFMAVFDINNPARPDLLQVVPTGISPEGVVAIPSRGLVITADEESGTLSLFQATRRLRRSAREPRLFSRSFRQPWAALSGLTAGRFGALYAVPDNALPTSIFRIQTGRPNALVTEALRVTRDGARARYDGEGIVVDKSILKPRFPGFWIASEGDAKNQPNLLVQIDGRGRVVREIQLPNAVDDGADDTLAGSAVPSATGGKIRSNGFEGVAMSPNGRYLYAAIQRDFANEFTAPKFTRIARYDLRQLRNPAPGTCDGLRCGGDWDFFFYRLDSADDDNWAGLSEIVCVGRNEFLVIERDKGIGLGSELKKIYRISLANQQPDTDGMPNRNDTVSKSLAFDILGKFFPYEKVEGLTVTRNGDVWVGLDNDGGEVESRLINLGRMR